MTVTIRSGPAAGTLRAIPSKSAAHRLLICAALGNVPTTIRCDGDSQDISATVRCLTGLGADIRRQGENLVVTPIDRATFPRSCTLDCGESGSTLRFLLPVAGALGAQATFLLAGRLAQRPMEPLASELARHGCALALDQKAKTLTISGQLAPGAFSLPGDVSSQFISGLLFALPILAGESTLTVTGEVQSAGYIHLTLRSLAAFQMVPQPLAQGLGWRIDGQGYTTPGQVAVEGDWSNAAPWLCMGALAGTGVTVTGLDPQSLQGDKEVCDILRRMGAQITRRQGDYTALPQPLSPTVIDARNIPDLVPVLAAVAACTPGETKVIGAERLRLKESDRLQTTAQTLNALGGDVTETPDGLIIRGKAALTGGTVDAVGDHRIAMAAAVASVACQGPVTVTGAQAVDKSYPTFWQEVAHLGKNVSQGA